MNAFSETPDLSINAKKNLIDWARWLHKLYRSCFFLVALLLHTLALLSLGGWVLWKRIIPLKIEDVEVFISQEGAGTQASRADSVPEIHDSVVTEIQNQMQMAANEWGGYWRSMRRALRKSPIKHTQAASCGMRRDTYYQNVNRDSVTRAYQLGMNIIVHILLQYQEELNRR